MLHHPQHPGHSLHYRSSSWPVSLCWSFPLQLGHWPTSARRGTSRRGFGEKNDNFGMLKMDWKKSIQILLIFMWILTYSSACLCKPRFRKKELDISRERHIIMAAFTLESPSSKHAAVVKPPKDMPVRAVRFTFTRPAKRLSWKCQETLLW